VIGTEDPDNLAGYVEGLGLTMPILLDASTTVYDDYRIEFEEGFAPYPREYIIGRDGTLLYLAADIDVPAMQAILDVELPPAR
jgi:peroxiredoxin